MLTWNVCHILDHAATAIIILNQPISCPSTFLLSQWERALIRITVDGGSNRWKRFLEQLPPEIKAPNPPHCITGDLDSITEETEALFRGQGVQFYPTPDQDENDFTKALRVVTSMEAALGVKIQYVLCICEHSGRLDQIMANMESLYHAQSWQVDWHPIIVSSDSLTWLLPAGRHAIQVPPSNVSSSLPCGLIPLKGLTTVTTNGLKWDLEKGDLEFGRLVSSSNTCIKTNVEIETSHHLIWTTVVDVKTILQ